MADDDIADLDLDRGARRGGFPEAVYCEGKSVDQCREIARRVGERPDVVTIFTRADADRAAAIREALPDSHHDPVARLLVWPPHMPEPTGELVVVACAGTSDLPVAREALLTARHLGRRAELVVDVGIAGVHRTLAQVDLFRSAGAIVVVAGMDGALPGLIAGLVSCPVVAVPTSVGYGAAFGGIAPLLTMLNACAPGVGVVNIDNGYGGGHLAAQIAAPRTLRTGGTMHRVVRPLALGLAGALALSGCALVRPGGDQPGPGDTRPVASPTVATTDAPTPAVPMQAEHVYFPRDSTMGLRLGREVRQVPQADPLRGVIETLLGQPLDPDYSTGWAQGTRLLSVTTTGPVTTVDLSTEARRGGKFAADFGLVSIDQLVWTVTELVGEDTLVDLTIEGEEPGELWGVTTWDAPRGREDALGVRVHVAIDAPNEGEAVRSPVRISGDAAAHEANVPWVIKDALGAVVEEGFTTSAVSMEFAPWSFEVGLEPGSYTVEVSGDDVGDTEGYKPDVDTRAFVVEG